MIRSTGFTENASNSRYVMRTIVTRAAAKNSHWLGLGGATTARNRRQNA